MGRPAQALNLWQLLADFPPVIVRLAARRATAGKNVAALSHAEIAIASMIPLARVIAISYSLSWDRVTVGEAEHFCLACGFDPTQAGHRRRQREYIRICQARYPNRPPHFLTVSPYWSQEILPLVNYLRSRMISSRASEWSRAPAEMSAAG